jgi:hypothetical protein
MGGKQQAALPFHILFMIEFAFGPGTVITFLEIPESFRHKFGGHPCGVQVQCRVGPDPGDFHYYHASGPDYIAALKSLITKARVSRFYVSE